MWAGRSGGLRPSCDLFVRSTGPSGGRLFVYRPHAAQPPAELRCLVGGGTGAAAATAQAAATALAAGDEGAAADVRAGRALAVAGVAAGPGHVLILTRGGLVFSAGQGTHGRLGHGGQDFIAGDTPRLVRALAHAGQPALRVAAGHDTSFALARGGRAFAWGYGFNGRLGTRSHESQLLPREVLAEELREL